MYANAGEATAGPAEAVSEVDGHGFIVAVEARVRGGNSRESRGHREPGTDSGSFVSEKKSAKHCTDF